MTTKPRPIGITVPPQLPQRRPRTSTHSVVRALRREIADDHYALLHAARY
jgi:hypothetical protein